MTRKVRRIAPLQLGKMMGVIYGLMGLIFLPFFFLAGLVGAFAQHAASDNSGAAAAATGIMLGFGLFMPVMYAVFGFVFGIISAALYNFVARWIGGIEVEIE